MTNLFVIFGTALVPLIIGFIWYNPKVLGTAWINSTGLSEEHLKKGNMPLIFGLTYLLGVFISAGMIAMTIHQTHIFSVFQGDPTAKDPTSATGMYIANFLKMYGTNFRTFKHGALHGTIAAIMLALPITGIVALFERKSFKYVAIHTGYWILTMMIMGGIVCQFFSL